MNNFVLMAEIIQDPQLRYTTDNLAIAEMKVQFPGLRADDRMSEINVVGIGNLAQEIQERYHQGDRVIIEGRLKMNTVERQEGFREKRAELIAQRIHTLNEAGFGTSTVTQPTGGAVPTPSDYRPSPSSMAPSSQPYSPSPAPRSVTSTPEPDYDDIPF